MLQTVRLSCTLPCRSHHQEQTRAGPGTGRGGGGGGRLSFAGASGPSGPFPSPSQPFAASPPFQAGPWAGSAAHSLGRGPPALEPPTQAATRPQRRPPALPAPPQLERAQLRSAAPGLLPHFDPASRARHCGKGRPPSPSPRPPGVFAGNRPTGGLRLPRASARARARAPPPAFRASCDSPGRPRKSLVWSRNAEAGSMAWGGEAGSGSCEDRGALRGKVGGGSRIDEGVEGGLRSPPQFICLVLWSAWNASHRLPRRSRARDWLWSRLRQQMGQGSFPIVGPERGEENSGLERLFPSSPLLLHTSASAPLSLFFFSHPPSGRGEGWHFADRWHLT